ncbi:MAG: hypothetical protein IT536_09160 [Hyphomicrobiales bacterium]|nr:hypothetical protein [Hyphomicrobiales bacterium]
MQWSRHDISLLKLSCCWGDTAAEIANILGKDIHEIHEMARKLDIVLKQRISPRAPQAKRSQRKIA